LSATRKEITNMNRRGFLQQGLSAAAAAAAAQWTTVPSKAALSPNERVTLCVAGVRGQGGHLLATFAGLSSAVVKYVCDVDESVLRQRIDETESRTGRRPEGISDFRRALDDPEVDALVLGTPDHWHAIPTIMACQAAKDVYVEKPDGHNLLEGRSMLAAMRKYSRVVQLGTQGRSSPHLLSAMEYLRSGHLGRPVCAKAWESSRQGALTKRPDGDPPPGVDYDMWLGPAPKRPFNPNRFHGNWRWFFDYGTGDLGNDGVHRLDMARWALESAMTGAGEGPLGLPQSVSAHGGKFYFEDEQEWPDTLQVTYAFASKLLTYEMRIWAPYSYHGESEGAAVFGDEGYMVIGNSRWRHYSPKGEVVAEDSGGYNLAGHAQNFIDCMHSRNRPAADLETVGSVSSMLCHLGNAAWRAGRTLRFDAENYRFIGDDDANRYLTRPEYRAPWKLPSPDQV